MSTEDQTVTADDDDRWSSQRRRKPIKLLEELPSGDTEGPLDSPEDYLRRAWIGRCVTVGVDSPFADSGLRSVPGLHVSDVEFSYYGLIRAHLADCLGVEAGVLRLEWEQLDGGPMNSDPTSSAHQKVRISLEFPSAERVEESSAPDNDLCSDQK